jgi:hypothetical protein
MLPTDKRAAAGQREVAEQLADLDEDGVEAPWGRATSTYCCPWSQLSARVGRISRYTNVIAWPGGERPGAKPGFFPVRQGDVLAYSFQGDGFGDPIERDPAAVVAGVSYGYLSRDMARDVSGVVIDDTVAPDQDATSRRRAEIRRQRCGGQPPNGPGAA